MKRKLPNITSKIPPIAAMAVILLGWEVVSISGIVPSYMLPSPVAVLTALFGDLPTILFHAKFTLLESFYGLLIGIALAFVFATMMDRFRVMDQAFYPIMIITQTIPTIAIAPILVLWMGFGMAPKILTVVLMCFFPVAVSFADGLQRVDEEYVHLVRSYGADRWKAYCLVKIPAALPELFSGLKVAATYSISGAVVGEWLGSQKGLGYYLLRVKNSYMLDKVFACVVVIILLSLAMNGLIRVIAKVSMPYERNKRS